MQRPAWGRVPALQQEDDDALAPLPRPCARCALPLVGARGRAPTMDQFSDRQGPQAKLGTCNRGLTTGTAVIPPGLSFPRNGTTAAGRAGSGDEVQPHTTDTHTSRTRTRKGIEDVCCVV